MLHTSEKQLLADWLLDRNAEGKHLTALFQPRLSPRM